jgi:hypothetical protein
MDHPGFVLPDPLGHLFDPIEDDGPGPSTLPKILPDFPGFDATLEQDVNNLSSMDLDSVCFMMLTNDLPDLLGQVARPANRQIHARDSIAFKDWIHVISDPIVVKIYGGDSTARRQSTKRRIISELKKFHHFTLTSNENQFVLSKNQVNVSMKFMAREIYNSGARACRVCFFGMKWDLPDAESKIDEYISNYNNVMNNHAIRGKNTFDIGVLHPSEVVDLFSFSVAQRHAQTTSCRCTHEMCNADKFGSLDFCVEVDACILRIKVYQELCHGVLSVIPKDFLDDMPRTMLTVKTRFYQMANLLNTWVQHMDEADRRELLLGTRIEVTVLDTEKIKDARGLCCRLDLLRIEGLERHLHGPFNVRSIQIGDVLINLHAQL